MISQHKPMCKSQMSCLVVHPDGVCPWKNECTCNEIKDGTTFEITTDTINGLLSTNQEKE